MAKNILIIHYNTPILTECLVRSVNRFVEDARVYIFDNSTVRPFTAEFENVTLLDNTKGQIIDFDKWLEKYPNKKKSGGKLNKWGSAKHCYSVEKSMELIGEPFVLLDSDVLLKRSISDLFDEEYIYIGEEITQPKSTVKRILPFICYINTPMCINNDVHYFNDNYMHGLYKTPVGDRYDTGGGFYLEASKFKHKKINCDDYVVHYGHGSWHKPNTEYVFKPEEWLLHNKKYWTNEMNKKVVYTCITGGYDTLKDPSKATLGFDYICFTDDPTIKSDVWDVRPLPDYVKDLPSVKQQRYVKINPHLLLKEYDLSIWVDGNVKLSGNLNDFMRLNVNEDDSFIYVPEHPSRKCIYKEAVTVIRMKKDKEEIINPQIERYRKEGFPENYGLLQSNILVRYHNTPDCIRLMEEWSNEVMKGSHRDQLSFNYASWKNNDVKVSYLYKDICKSQWFTWNGIHTKNTKKDKPVSKHTTETSKQKTFTIAESRKEMNSIVYNNFNQY